MAASFAGELGYAASAGSSALTIAKAAQAIDFAALPDRIATDPPFTVGAGGGGSGNPVTFSTASTACSVSGTTVTLNAQGSCAIDADQAGNLNYEDALRVTRTFAIAFAPQTITFPAIASFTWNGGSATLAATAESGLAVTYSVLSGPCQVTGSTLTATAAGSCLVAADQAGDDRYGAAAQVTQSVQVDRASQTIVFAPLGDKIATDPPFTVSATGGASGNPVTFFTDSTACSVSGTTVTLIAAGECAIKADQAGNTNYSAAPQVTRTFNITAASQTITFPPIASFTWNGGSATLTATASSGLAVTYSVLSGPCQVTGSTLTATAAGPCVIAADQAGNAKYSAAPQVTASAQVDRSPQTILFGALANKTYGDPDVPLSASASSGLPVSFAATGACALSGSAVHITGAGSCAVTASQPGDANYLPATDVTRTFTIARKSLTVKADNKVKLLNSPNPPLTGTLTGVVNGDGITASFSTTAVTNSPVGLYPIVPSLADPNGRLGNYTVQILNGTLAIIFAPTGTCMGEPDHQILPPINPNGTSVFKPKTTIDVRFRVCDARGVSIGTPGLVVSFKLVQIIRGGVTTNVSLDPVSEKHGKDEGGFRFDDGDRDDFFWVFHLSTKDLASDTTYVYRIVLNDGSTIDFRFTLKKKGDKDDNKDERDNGKT